MVLAELLVLSKLLEAKKGGVAPISDPKTNPWAVLTGQGARDVTYTVTLDPADVAAYRERERVNKALRML